MRILPKPRSKGFWVGQAFGQRLRRDITKKSSEPRPRRFWDRQAFKRRLRRDITKKPSEPRPRRFWGRQAFKQRLRRGITKKARPSLGQGNSGPCKFSDNRFRRNIPRKLIQKFGPKRWNRTSLQTEA